MFTDIAQLQKLILLLSWYQSDVHAGGRYLTQTDMASHLNIKRDSIRDYLYGRSRTIKSIKVIMKLESLIADLKESITNEQFEYLKDIYDNFYFENSFRYPGIHGVGQDAKGYSKGFSNPDTVAKHIVELCLRQGGLMPAGKRGEKAENYNIDIKTARHHINFFKAESDAINLILMGNLHAKFTRLEGTKDLDYYTLMRYMRDSFEAARPPSFWDAGLQDEYIERLKEFVTEWESTKSSIRYTNSKGEKVDFIKISYGGETFNLQGMLRKGWITEKWVNGIIADIKLKLTNY